MISPAQCEEHYVTLFDSLFLPQVLALHTSMMRHVGQFTLWTLCVDDAAADILQLLALPNVRTIRLSAVETPDLTNVRPGRGIGEYCWTLTPFAPGFVFDVAPEVERVTYMDADLWFIRSPAPLFAELTQAGKDVLITDHAYAPDYDQGLTTGRFCVQFVTFSRRGEPVRRWWADRCLEWCFDRQEDGKFGDQKYLDDWPQRFPSHVHVLKQTELTLAPWNASRFPASSAVFYHFHRFRILGRDRVEASRGYDIPRSTFDSLYRPYTRDIFDALSRLEAIGVATRAQGKGSTIYHRLGVLYKRLRRMLFAARTVHRLHRREV